jgi:CO/xanthine dehydrogenase FAD-binding subunit
MTDINNYIRATSTIEAMRTFENAESPIRFLAGGTDLLLKLNAVEEPPITLVDISAIEEICGIQQKEGGLYIGAATRLSDIVNSDMFIGALQIVAEGARRIGSPQIRNLATIGGNLCNAAPSADTAAPLLVLEATAEIIVSGGKRSIPLSEFFTGPGQTVLELGELLAGLWIPTPPAGAASIYIKQSPRQAMDLAVAGISILMARTKEALDVRVALAAVSPTPIRVPEAEKLIMQSDAPGEEVILAAARLAAEAARPINDVRASVAYRLEMVETLTARALRAVYQKLEQS